MLNIKKYVIGLFLHASLYILILNFMNILTFLFSLLSGAFYKADPVQEKLDILSFFFFNFVAEIKSKFLHIYCISHISGYTCTLCYKLLS